MKLDLNNGWQEAVVMVSDLDPIANDLMAVGNWEIAGEGPVGQVQLTAWGLDESTSANYRLIKNPDTTKGMIRLVKIDEVTQEQIRPAGQIWEAGGIFDLNFRVTNVDQKFKELLARGWTAYNEPAEYSFGPVVVSEVLMVGPDGVAFALIERIAPPLEEVNDKAVISKSFNSTMIVRDIGKAADFFEYQLGFKPAMEVLDHHLPEGANVLGLPHNIVTNHAMDVYIFQQNGVADGSLELLHLRGLEGRDFSERAKPYNLGITALRFPVNDIERRAATFKSNGASLVMEPTQFDLYPYGKIKSFAIELPEGGWIEFFEQIN